MKRRETYMETGKEPADSAFKSPERQLEIDYNLRKIWPVDF